MRKWIGWDRRFPTNNFIAVVCVFWVSDWIYNTKEAKVQAHWEAYLIRNRSGINLMDRGPGEYEVSCRPGLSNECFLASRFGLELLELCPLNTFCHYLLR